MPWGGRPVQSLKLPYRLQARDLAPAFGLTQETIYRLAKAGKITSRRQGPYRTFPHAVIGQMLKLGYALRL